MSVPWLEQSAQSMEARCMRLRGMIGSGKSTLVAGAFDGMSARLARDAGFHALYLSGAALSASKALPDLGMLTLEDVTRATRDIVRASDLPVIVDCDTGFGEVLNVMRTVKDLEEAGAAAIQIEDQDFPKKCGHLNDKRLIPVEDMCRKIAAARQASADLLICARTDAAARSLDEAIARARGYAASGADIIFVEALTSEDHFRRVRGEIEQPLLANMTEFGTTPALSMADWEKLGYELVIFPVSAFRIASRAIQQFYAQLRESGTAEPALPNMMSRRELYEVISYFDYEALDQKILRTVLPDDGEATE